MWYSIGGMICDWFPPTCTGITICWLQAAVQEPLYCVVYRRTCPSYNDLSPTGHVHNHALGPHQAFCCNTCSRANYGRNIAPMFKSMDRTKVIISTSNAKTPCRTHIVISQFIVVAPKFHSSFLLEISMDRFCKLRL